MKKKLVVAAIFFGVALISAGLFGTRIHAQRPGAPVLKSWGPLRAASSPAVARPLPHLVSREDLNDDELLARGAGGLRQRDSVLLAVGVGLLTTTA